MRHHYCFCGGPSVVKAPGATVQFAPLPLNPAMCSLYMYMYIHLLLQSQEHCANIVG